jgi:Cu/Ag efflux pump CusA
MTTLSIIAGLIPVAMGIGAGSEQRASIAVTIIGGQTLCLLLTLVVVPVAYSYLSEVQSFGWREWATRVLRLVSPPRPTEGD